MKKKLLNSISYRHQFSGLWECSEFLEVKVIIIINRQGFQLGAVTDQAGPYLPGQKMAVTHHCNDVHSVRKSSKPLQKIQANQRRMKDSVYPVNR